MQLRSRWEEIAVASPMCRISRLTQPRGRPSQTTVSVVRRGHASEIEAQVLTPSTRLWEAAPIVPKTPPNPLATDREFLAEFPYLAEPHAGY